MRLVKTLLLALSFARVQQCFAQGDLGISNLTYVDTSGSASSLIPFGRDINFVVLWVAQGFQTGTNSGGYLVNTVTIPFYHAFGFPTNFSLSVFSATSNSGPDISLGILSGNSNPNQTSNYTFTATGLFLKPNTPYYLVAEATGTVNYENDQFLWYRANTKTSDSTDGWG